MSTELMFALMAGLAAVGYGMITIKWIMSKPMGNSEMVSIANAVQEGASAYLNRQYKTISFVGIVLFLIIGLKNDAFLFVLKFNHA